MIQGSEKEGPLAIGKVYRGVMRVGEYLRFLMEHGGKEIECLDGRALTQ